jgi:hypothetical protein
MKKLTKILVLSILAVFLVAGSAMAAPFTMNSTQLQALYETWENPDSSGTYLNPVQAITNGAKYTGNVRTSEGWGTIQIGANFWGTPYGGSAGNEPDNVSLGMGSLSGYDSYALVFENVDETPWMYQLYFNVGWCGQGWNEPDYYVQNTWTTIGVDDSKAVVLDFTNAEVWKNGVHQGWQDLTLFSDINWNHITNIGFQIGGNMPVGPDDYTFETQVSPVPEPATMLLLGSGLLGLAAFGRRKFFKKA